MKRICALIPCRLDSSRLPRKALMDVAGEPAIVRLIHQTTQCKYVDRADIVVCTTDREIDDELAATVENTGASVFRGSTDDLVDRLYHAAQAVECDIVLEIDGDDICADPEYMDLAVKAVVDEVADVAITGTGLPLGAGSKAFSTTCLARVFESYVPGKNDTGFTYYLTRSGLFSVHAVLPIRKSHVMPELRLTLDYEQDLQLFRQIYAMAGRSEVNLDAIRKMLDVAPSLAGINAGLDEQYWERTEKLLHEHPLRLRVDGTIRNLLSSESDGES